MLLFTTCRALTAVCLVVAVSPIRAHAPTPRRVALPRRTAHTIAPGIALLQEIVAANGNNGPLTVTVLRVEARKVAQIHAALGQDQVWGNDPTLGREIVTRYVARHQPGVIAAINASFFGSAGNPLGLHVQNGEMVTEASNNRSVFCLMKNGGAKIERFRFTGHVTVGRTSYPVAGLNRHQGRGNELLAFTPRFGRFTPRAPHRVEVVLAPIKKVLVPRGAVSGAIKQTTMGGATPLANQTLVLSGSGTAATFLRHAIAAKGKITLHVNTQAVSGSAFTVQRIREAVAGGPRLVTNGRITVRGVEENLQAIATKRHPRTAIGIARDGAVLLLTVDGRQPGVSQGVSLAELARILVKWGAYNGVNLDGGGSSVLVVRGLLVNAPSEGQERPVANLLTVNVPNSKPMRKKESSLSFRVPWRPLRVGETWTLVSPVQKEGVWGLPGGQPVVGFVSQRGVFQAVRPGTASISWIPDAGKSRTVSVSVVPAPSIPRVPSAGKVMPRRPR